MIFIGLGANLPTRRFGPPKRSLAAAIDSLNANDIMVELRSPWYRSAPIGNSDQPWFVNAVVAVRTRLAPEVMLATLHRIETEFGRVRRAANEARPLDLDLIAYDDLVAPGPAAPILPHPRLHERAFVLLPLRDIAAGWIHPVTGLPVEALITALPPGQACERDDSGPE